MIPSMALCINIFTEPGDQVLIQTPVYHPFYHVVAANRRSLVTSPLVEEGAATAWIMTTLPASLPRECG